MSSRAKIIDKILKLEALAESSNPHEAKLARTMADRFKKNHRITDEDLRGYKDQFNVPEIIIDISPPDPKNDAGFKWRQILVGGLSSVEGLRCGHSELRQEAVLMGDRTGLRSARSWYETLVEKIQKAADAYCGDAIAKHEGDKPKGVYVVQHSSGWSGTSANSVISYQVFYQQRQPEELDQMAHKIKGEEKEPDVALEKIRRLYEYSYAFGAIATLTRRLHEKKMANQVPREGGDDFTDDDPDQEEEVPEEHRIKLPESTDIVPVRVPQVNLDEAMESKYGEPVQEEVVRPPSGSAFNAGADFGNSVDLDFELLSEDTCV